MSNRVHRTAAFCGRSCCRRSFRRSLLFVGALTLVLAALTSVLAVGVAEAQFVEPVNLLFSWDGEADGDQFGFVNRMFGDIDSDGVADIGVGVPRHDGNGEDSGKVYIFSGRTGVLLRTHEGNAANEFLGYEIANVGDVTNDGVPDYLIARPRSINFSQYFGPGEAILYSGATGDSLHAWSSAQLGSGAAAQVGGAGSFETLGVGDVNADGTPDFLISALIAVGPNGLAGKVYVVSGANWDEYLWVLNGEAPIDLFGFGVGGVGDLDSDGHADFIVGAPRAGVGDHGRAYVYSGATGELFPFAPLEADSTGAFYGALFAKGPGDVDADGVPDICVGDVQDSENGANSGKAYVYSGADGHVLHIFRGEAGSGLGVGRGCGDVNHDGHADLVYSAFLDPANAEFAGTTYVFSGADGSVLRTIHNTLEGDRFGYSTVGAGDLNGDGEPDFVVSATQHDGAGVDRGKVYVISGATDPASAPDSEPVPSSSDESRLELRLGPNPASSQVDIRFRALESGSAEVAVFDVSGARVVTLLDAVLSEGPHAVHWDRTGEQGRRVASGVYYVRVRTDGEEAWRSVVLR